MAAAASETLRRLARGPDSQNAARLLRTDGGMPSESIGPPDLSLQELIEGKEVTDNARAHYKSGKRTHTNRHDDQLLKNNALFLEGARPVAVVQSIMLLCAHGWCDTCLSRASSFVLA
eukprot:4358662-Pleurochrysis_carterae.AAC.1